MSADYSLPRAIRKALSILAARRSKQQMPLLTQQWHSFTATTQCHCSASSVFISRATALRAVRADYPSTICPRFVQIGPAAR
jgi:hypothetical protein